MRHIKTIEDAQIAIRELYDFMDLYKSKDIDLQKRRVKNASPSVELYDYVVRKELKDLESEVKQQREGIAVEFYNVVFTTAGVPIVGDPSSPYYIVQRQSELQKVAFVAGQTPASTFEWNIKANNVNIFSSNKQVGPSYTPKTVLTYTDFDTSSYSTEDLIHVVVVDSGSIQRVTIELYFKVT